MRSSKSLVLAGIVSTMAVMAMVFGCSDDETPVAPPPDDNGIESLLGVVQEQVHQYLDSATEIMESALEVATFVDAGTDDIGDAFMGGVLPDSTRDNNVWIVSWLTDLSSGTGTMFVVDSLTYVKDGGLQVTARNAEEMYVKHHYTYQSDDTTLSFTDLSHSGMLHIEGIQQGQATIAGGLNAYVENKQVTAQNTVWNNWTIEVQATNLVFDKDGEAWSSGCPNSGNCSVNVTYVQARNEDLPTMTNWQFDITFTDGLMDVDVSVGQLRTSYEHQLCTP